MDESDSSGILYIKNGLCGTVYIIVDKKDPITLKFVHNIRLEVTIHDGKSAEEHYKRTPQEEDIPERDDVCYLPCETDDTEHTESDQTLTLMEKTFSGTVALSKLNDESNVQTRTIAQSLLPRSRRLEKRQCVAVPIDSPPARTRNASKLEGGLTQSISHEGNQSGSVGEKIAPTRGESKRKRMSPKKKEKGVDRKGCDAGTAVKVNKLSARVKKMKNQTKVVDGSKYVSRKPTLLKQKSPKWKLAREITCQYCLKVFENQQSFYNHKKTSRNSSYECEVCHKQFSFKAYLQAHAKAYHLDHTTSSNLKETDPCICHVCGSEVKNLFALKKHLMVHTQEYLYECCICGKQFVEPGTLNNHMTTHKSGGMIRCKCCDQLFATRAALAKHKLSLLEVKCHLCEETFPNRTSRTQHYKQAHPSDILKCPKCSSMFSSQEELGQHLNKHSRYKKKQCTICGKLFSRLEKHILTHKVTTEINESDLFVCDKCPRKFTNRSSLQRHLSIHSQEKPYQCPSCPLQFADCGVLRKHLRRHSSLMPYECEVCGKRCKESSNLKVHMRIHSDTKQFHCPLCSQGFNYKSSLESHIRSRHSQSPAVLAAQISTCKQEYENKMDSDVRQAQTYDFRMSSVNAVRPETSGTQNYVSANRTDVSMKPSDIQNVMRGEPLNSRAGQVHESHPVMSNSLGMDLAQKDLYTVDSTTHSVMNLPSTLYTQEGQPVVHSHPSEGSSLNVMSLDVTTVNVSSMNVSLY